MPTIPEFEVRDLKLGALVDLAHEKWNIPRFTNPRLKAVSDGMRANVSRVRSTMLIPTTIAGYVDEIRTWLDQAEFDVVGKSSPPGHVYPPDVHEKIQSRFVELHTANRVEGEKLLGTPAWDERVLKHHREALHGLGPITRSPMGAHGFLAIFSAHVTGTWTAIETMCGDLWEAALNCHPQTLAALNGKSDRIGKLGAQKTKPENVSLDPSTSKAVSLNLIQMHQYDIRDKMGTMLREKFEFSRLTTTRQAYSCAFSERSSRVDTALANKSLDAISIMRNALVHKAGRADAEYLRRADLLSLPKPKIGEPILLDGQVVSDLIRPAIKTASSLMNAVSDWIDQN